VEELGADTLVIFAVDAPPVDVSEVREAAGDDDALIAVDGALFTARVDPTTSARPAATLRLAVDPSKFHYFDPETGLRLDTAAVSAPVVAAT
jgi:multiple sugar transport system ATP-binding protein